MTNLSNSPSQNNVELPKKTATNSLGFDELNTRVQVALGKSLFTYLDEGSAKGVFKNEQQLREFYSRAVSRIVYAPASAAALFVSFSEELNFSTKDGNLVLPPFGGSNAPHSIVNQFTNELLKKCTIDADGRIHGVGTIKIDDGSKRNKIEVRIDFDKKLIIPPLMASTVDGTPERITTDSLQTFFNTYFKPENNQTIFIREGAHKDGNVLSGNGKFLINPNLLSGRGMNIFLDEATGQSNDPKTIARSAMTIRHELAHALFDSHPDYRKLIINTVKNATTEQREASVVYLAGLYDLFDPDLVKRGRELIVDEAWNAFKDSNYYNPITMKGLGFFLKEYSTKKNFVPDFSEFGSLDKLPLTERSKVALKKVYDKTSATLSESEFLRTQGSQIVPYLNDAGVFLKLLKNQAPEQYAKIQDLRKKFVDWVDKE